MSAKLYYTPTSCGAANFIAAHKAGLIGTKIIASQVSIFPKKEVLTGAEKGSDFSKINPKGNVPTIILPDGKLLNENFATLNYIAAQNPSAKLIPAAGTPEHYLLLSKLSYVGTEVHKAVGPLFGQLDPATEKFFRDRVAVVFKYLNDIELSSPDKKFLVGDDFTIADSYLYIVLSWSEYLKLPRTEYDNLEAYFQRVKALDFVQEAHAAMAKASKE